MGLEILDEFRSIMPIRTVPTVKTFTQPAEVETSSKEEEQECHTPTSQPQTLLVCPPPPKKPRVVSRTTASYPSQGFFQVPHDLASVFLLHAKVPSALTSTSQNAL